MHSSSVEDVVDPAKLAVINTMAGIVDGITAEMLRDLESNVSTALIEYKTSIRSGLPERALKEEEVLAKVDQFLECIVFRDKILLDSIKTFLGNDRGILTGILKEHYDSDQAAAEVVIRYILSLEEKSLCYKIYSIVNIKEKIDSLHQEQPWYNRAIATLFFPAPMSQYVHRKLVEARRLFDKKYWAVAKVITSNFSDLIYFIAKFRQPELDKSSIKRCNAPD